MLLNWIDRIGDWNPQFFREVKGRFKPRNLMIVSLLSITAQVLYWFIYESSLPIAIGSGGETYNRYCTGTKPEYSYSALCVLGENGHFLINWPQWWLDLYIVMGIVGIFTLIVAGTYLIMNDLCQEEHKGTLNFLRLSPRKSLEILLGKMFGVPILLYVFILLAVPFHLWAGFQAKINFGLLIGFYLVSIAASTFFLSAVALSSFFIQWLGGFQPWLGAAASLGLLSILAGMSSIPITNTAFDFLGLCSPFQVLAFMHSKGLKNTLFESYVLEQLSRWQWFNLPIGQFAPFFILLVLASYGTAIYWLWEGLKRCFRNPHLPVWSKRQSYWITGCLQVLWIGFAVQNQAEWGQVEKWNNLLFGNLAILLGWNFLWFGVLIFTLAPQRQTLQDWSRYHRRPWLRELVWGEKSPSLGAIVLNLLLACAAMGLWAISVQATGIQHLQAFGSLLSFATLILIYACIVQQFLFLKTPLRNGLALAAVSLLVVVPYLILAFYQASPDDLSQLWLFTPITAMPWGYGELALVDALLPLGLQWLVLGLLTSQFSRRLKLAGMSSTQAILTGVHHP